MGRTSFRISGSQFSLSHTFAPMFGEDYFDALGFDYDFDYSTPEFVDEEDILGRDTLIPLGALDNDEQPAVGIGGDDEEIVEEWRPMSPGGGGFADDNDRYDF